MKKCLSVILLLCSCLLLSGAEFTEDGHTEITAFGYTFLLPTGLVYHYCDPLGTDRLWKMGCDEAFVIEIVPLDRLIPTLSGTSIEEREACLKEFAALMEKSDHEIELTHRDSVSILYKEDDASHWLIAVAGPSAPCFIMRLVPSELEKYSEYTRKHLYAYQFAFDYVLNTLSYSYFQTDPEAMTEEELLFMREQIDQMLMEYQ